MLSYARIAGFAIAHAAFALVVGELLHTNPALGIGLGLIFLNMFALTLELLVCMIQALRLLYYEFSTKFFKGTGVPYIPYRL
jgi:V/A-type H+-transporting ATPase subunit I